MGNGVNEKKSTLVDDSAIGNNRVEEARSSNHATHSGLNSINATMEDKIGKKLDDRADLDEYLILGKEKRSSLDDNTVLESFPPLPTQVTTSAGNAFGKFSFANVTGKTGGKKLNIHTCLHQE
nr:hypothetical protein [Tanacetum cinerariifolium]